MSVINQMLRDLDAREASAQERADLPRRLRTLPPSRTARYKPWQILVAGLGAGMLVAIAAMSLLSSSPSLPPPSPSFAPPAPPAPPPSAAPAVLPLASPPVIAAEPLPTSSVAPPVAQEAEASAAAVRKTEPEMKMETQLTVVPAPKAAEPTRPAAKPPKEVKASVATTEPTITTSSAAKPAEAAPGAQIDKRNAEGQAREMAETEYRKGMQAVRRGEGAAALPVLQRAVEFDPLHAKARQAILSVLVSGKQWQEAQRVAQAGLALDPTQTGWAAILARLQFEQGDTTGALDTLARHTAHAANDADYHGLFAYLLQKQQRFDEASKHFKTALALRPQEGRWWFGLGLALENAGRGGEARDAYTKAREVGNLPADMAATIEQKLK